MEVSRSGAWTIEITLVIVKDLEALDVLEVVAIEISSMFEKYVEAVAFVEAAAIEISYIFADVHEAVDSWRVGAIDCCKSLVAVVFLLLRAFGLYFV